MDKTTSSNLCLPTLDGRAKMLQMWWLKFCAYAAVFRFTHSIQKTVDPDLPKSEDADVDNRNTAAKKAKKAKAVAMASLTMAFTSKSLIGMLYDAKTADWPSGLASKIVVALHEKYVLQDM
eukprot:7813339-Ditylum_brightwellii.AAC.1